MRVCDWPDADLAYLLGRYATTANTVLAEQLGRTASAVYAKAKRLGLAKDATYLRSLKRGFRARAAIGAERICDGYLVRKVAEARWVAVHVLTWEVNFGPVPDGHIVMFKDGDRTNVAIENLECISRAEQLQRYTVINLPDSIREVIWLKGALTRKINAHDN